MAKILIIDNTFDPPHGSPEIAAMVKEICDSQGLTYQLDTARAPDEKIPVDLSAYQAVILSGSKTRILENAPWIDLEMKAIEQLYAKNIPTFGICYGEQLIARTLGGLSTVGVAKVPEYGWIHVQCSVSEGIFAGVSKQFSTFSYHSDEVFSLPAGFLLMASSERCRVQAFSVAERKMWGVQFHCERPLEHGNRSLQRKREQDPALEIVNINKGNDLYEPDLGRRVFSNFLKEAGIVS